MTELVPSGAVARALRQYRAAHGVIDHVLISPNPEREPHAEFHRRAALFTLDVLARRFDAYIAKLLTKPPYQNRERSEFFRITADPDQLTGRVVEVDEFIGPWWERESLRVVPTDESSGYAYAFFHPPYSLSCSEAKSVKLFRALTDALFGGFHEPLFVYEWSTECSTYFDAGREWWGTFFWTIEHRDSGRVVGVAASSTD